MLSLKKIRHLIYVRNEFLRKLRFCYYFWRRNRYWPDFDNPKTYNEKVNFRKRNAKNELFSVCSDKIAAKKWVAERVGEEYVIPNYFVGEFITADKLREIIAEKGDCLLKANHNSGPVKILTKESTDREIEEACKDINNQLKVDFGEKVGEPWYSKIKPGVLVEKRLEPEEGESDIRDYKFHVFKQADGDVKIFVAVDFDRRTNHSRSFFDAEFNYMHLSTKVPSIRTSLRKPENFEKMLELAKKLAEPFSYVRVDLYNVGGRIYFGEMTFAPGGGYSDQFESYKYDLWMGRLWQGDPSC